MLTALGPGGKFGNIFSQPTTEPMRRDRPVVFDVSAIPASQSDLRAAALLASWSAGFAVINIAQVLADVGIEARRNSFVILDELHQALKAGPGIVDRVDYLTRLNRNVGVGIAMITHTLQGPAVPPRWRKTRKRPWGSSNAPGWSSAGDCQAARGHAWSGTFALTRARPSG